MFSAPSSVSSVGSEPPDFVQSHQARVQVINDIRTNNAEQLQTNHVAPIQEESGAIRPESDGDQANPISVSELLMSRSTVSRVEVREEKATDRANQVMATVAFQRSMDNAASQVRDAGADTTVSVDITI